MGDVEDNVVGLAIAVFIGAATGHEVRAADLSAAPMLKAPMRSPAYDWTGFYIGGNVGGSAGRSSTDVVLTPTSTFLVGPGPFALGSVSQYMVGGLSSRIQLAHQCSRCRPRGRHPGHRAKKWRRLASRVECVRGLYGALPTAATDPGDGISGYCSAAAMVWHRPRAGRLYAGGSLARLRDRRARLTKAKSILTPPFR